ncbi:MAG: ECF transporter S component [Armatimonadetes bacterium]|nr:ECF transporter S component [Armatimonadota bacterium]
MTDSAVHEESRATQAEASTERRLVLDARDLALAGLFGALGIVVPIAFHALGPGMGPIFLPMYLPILALGLLASPSVSAQVGFITPLLSSVLTGMPPLAPPVAILMAFELAALAGIAGAARAARLPLLVACVAGIVASRIAGALALMTIGRALGYDKSVVSYALLSFAMAWPGILLQLTVVPGAVALIERTSILGPRWGKKR